MEESVKIIKVIRLIEDYGGIDGGHHKQWLIDKIIRVLVDDYDRWVKDYCRGEDGQKTYHWDKGIAP